MKSGLDSFLTYGSRALLSGRLCDIIEEAYRSARRSSACILLIGEGEIGYAILIEIQVSEWSQGSGVFIWDSKDML